MQSSVPLTRGTPAAYAPAAPRVAVRSLRTFADRMKEKKTTTLRDKLLILVLAPILIPIVVCYLVILPLASLLIHLTICTVLICILMLLAGLFGLRMGPR